MPLSCRYKERYMVVMRKTSEFYLKVGGWGKREEEEKEDEEEEEEEEGKED